MKTIILGFAGPIGSGKSALSDKVAKILGWRRVSFGDYVKRIAKQRGLAGGRNGLQILGEELISSGGWYCFSLDVLQSGGWSLGTSLVVDGIRHLEVLDALKSIVSPGVVLLIYVSAPDTSVRLHRTRLLSANQLKRLDAHSTEIQVQTVLRTHADLVVGQDEAVEDSAMRILRWSRMKNVS